MASCAGNQDPRDKPKGEKIRKRKPSGEPQLGEGEILNKEALVSGGHFKASLATDGQA
jgi:hypothetical protein